MSKRGENIYLRGDGRWEGRCIIGRKENGTRRYRYIYGRSYQEVKEKLAIERANLHLFCGQIYSQGQWSLPPSPTSQYRILPDQEIPVSFLAGNWLASKRDQVKESTYIKYRNLTVSYILPILGPVKWNDLNREVIERFCQQLLRSGGTKRSGLSSKTVSDIMSAVRSIFRYAQGLGYETLFDIASIEIKNESKEMRILTRKEQDRLCRYLCANLNNKNIGLLLCIFIGLRLGEICALRWEDISFSERTIHIHRTMQRIQTGGNSEKKTTIMITSPKSRDSIRTIPLPDELAEILMTCPCGKSGYVLTGKENTYVEPRTMERYFEGVLEKVGLEKVNFHALRHTFATRCVEMDFDVKSLSEILGHSSVTITMNRYVHPSMELKHQNMQRLSELLAVSHRRQGFQVFL